MQSGFRAGIPTFSGYVIRTWIYMLLCCEPSWRMELFGREVWSWLQLLICGHVGFLVMRPYTASRLFSQGIDCISQNQHRLGGLKLLRLVMDPGASFAFKTYEVLTSFSSHMHILANLCWASQFLELVTRNLHFEPWYSSSRNWSWSLGQCCAQRWELIRGSSCHDSSPDQ